MATNLVPANSDRARFDFLKSARNSGQADITADKGILSQEQVDSVKATIDPYRQAMLASRDAYADRRNAVAARTEILEKLSHNIRDFWTSLINRNKRNSLPPGLLEYYRLPTDGGRPKVTTKTRWVQLGEDLIDGEKLALEKGFPAMSNPSVADITEFLGETEQAGLVVTQTDSAYQDVQEELTNLRKAVDTQMRELARQFRFHLADHEASARRRIMRRYGFTFTQEFENDGPEPEPVPEA